MKRFDRLLHAMATQPEPSEKQQGDNQTSDTGVLAQVMAILELAKVSLQVLLRNPNVSPVDPALHVGPKAFNRIGVNVAANVFLALNDRRLRVRSRTSQSAA